MSSPVSNAFWRRLNYLKSNPKFGRRLKINVDGIIKSIIRHHNGNTDEHILVFICSDRAKSFPEYGYYLTRIKLNIHDETSFSEKFLEMRLIDESCKTFVRENAPILDSYIQKTRDYEFTWFEYQALQEKYKSVEKPQFLYMRVAVMLGMPYVERIRKFYTALSLQHVVLSPQIMTYACVSKHFYSSFCLSPPSGAKEDVLECICFASRLASALADVSIDLTSLNSSDAPICAGLEEYREAQIEKCHTLTESMADFIDIKDQKIGLYMGVWSESIMSHLKRSAFNPPNVCSGIMVPDLFMKTYLKELESPEDLNIRWHLFNDVLASELNSVYGDEFDKKYAQLVSNKQSVSHIKPSSVIVLWRKAMIKTGNTQILFRDAMNRRSNGHVCTHLDPTNTISVPTHKKNIGIGIIGAVNLNRCVYGGALNFKFLEEHTTVLTNMLNSALTQMNGLTDLSKKLMPMGIGVIGAADIFAKLCYDYNSSKAILLMDQIQATVYHSAMSASPRDVRHAGGQILQPDLVMRQNAGHVVLNLRTYGQSIKKHKWKQIERRTVTNKLVTAAVSLDLFHISDGCWPFGPLIENREVKGEHYVSVNREFYIDAESYWSPDLVEEILKAKGSIQGTNLPVILKKRYKTKIDTDPETIVLQAININPYISQGIPMSYCVKSTKLEDMFEPVYQAYYNNLPVGVTHMRFLRT